uniref:Uncharacterized protein n=2 Tax=Caenorhabditis japonica TaxID=281687 RepID=A0A8R1I613_CAEJA
MMVFEEICADGKTQLVFVNEKCFLGPIPTSKIVIESSSKTVHLLHVQKPLNSGAKPISLVSSMDGFESGLDFAVWGYSTQQIATKNNANLEALKISLKKAWDDLDVNTCVPSLTRTRRDSELSSRLKVDDLKTVYATYLLLFK